jgi:hypothetical protein
VVIPPARAEADTARARQIAEANLALAGRIRDLGTDRVLFATDWDGVPMAEYVGAVRALLPLDGVELAGIMGNVGPPSREP